MLAVSRDRDQLLGPLEVPRLTTGQRRIFNALTAEWKTASQFVDSNATATEIAGAARHANELVKLGLAEKSDTYRNPAWRQSAILRDLVR